jgi:hypothetical protein
MDPKEQLRTAKAIIMTTYGTNGRTILMEETKETSFLDFLVDGVVSLTYSDVYGESEGGRVYEDRLERRSVREIEFKKLKGTRISNKRYTFTLEGGKFRHLPPFHEDLSVRPSKITDLTDKRISSGVPDLDRITQGFKKGSFNLFEVEHGVDLRYLQIHTQIALNAVMNRKGMIIIPSIGEAYPTQSSKEIILHCHRADDIESEIESIKETTEKNFNSEQLSNGLVILLGLDTFVSRFGSDTMLTMVEAIISYARESGATIIATMKRAMESLEYITHMADTHIVFKDLNNALVIYGMRPKTGLYAVDLIDNQVRLIPVV